MLLLRRSVAALLGFLFLSSVALLFVWWDAKSNILYGWDGVQLGYAVVTGLALLVALISRQPPFYFMLGLRLENPNGAALAPLPRVVRSLMTAVLVSGPGSLRLADSFNATPLSVRSKILAGLSILLATAFLPALSTVASKGARSISDILIGSRVVLIAKSPNPQTRYGLPFTAAIVSGAYALAILGAVLIDWRFALSETFVSLLRQRTGYVQRVAEGLAAMPTHAIDLVRQEAPTPNYWNHDYTVFFPGAAEAFRFQVPPRVLKDEAQRTAVAVDGLVAVHDALGPTTKWVEVTVYAEHNFGPAALTQSFTYLLNRQTRKLSYAPTEQLFMHGTQELTWEQSIAREDAPDSVIIVYKREPHGSIAVLNVGWDFPRLDFTAEPWRPRERFVGG